MNSTINVEELTEGNLLDEKHMSIFFNVLKANVTRSRIPITAIFLTVSNQNRIDSTEVKTIDQEVTSFFQTMIRQTDLLFKLSPSLEWCILLSHSGEEEANAFLERLFKVITSQETSYISFVACVAEINNSDVEFEDLLARGREALALSLNQGDWHIHFLSLFKERKLELVKISILEDDEIFCNVLSTTLENLSVSHFELSIQMFSDGYEFLKSDWYYSGHTHLIIMNDILPRKNGLEVLHTLRNLPNSKKFIIFMMTKRKSEEDMIFSYENGVDQYLVKPFNLRLFQAQMKRTFERLWS